jgi:hypothetical protein
MKQSTLIMQGISLLPTAAGDDDGELLVDAVDPESCQESKPNSNGNSNCNQHPNAIVSPCITAGQCVEKWCVWFCVLMAGSGLWPITYNHNPSTHLTTMSPQSQRCVRPRVSSFGANRGCLCWERNRSHEGGQCHFRYREESQRPG